MREFTRQLKAMVEESTGLEMPGEPELRALDVRVEQVRNMEPLRDRRPRYETFVTVELVLVGLPRSKS